MESNTEDIDVSISEPNLRLRRLESFRIDAGPTWPSDQCTEEKVQSQLKALDGKLLFPGNLICASVGDILDGQGTRLKCGWIVSKVMGRLKVHRSTKQYKSKFAPFPVYTSTNTVIEVHSLRQNVALSPVDGEKVAAFITFVGEKFAKCRITHNHQGVAFQRPYYRGTIKAEDAGGEVNASLMDKFEPGNSVFALFSSDRSHGGFNLRTDKPDLGIVVRRTMFDEFSLPIREQSVVTDKNEEVSTFLRDLKRTAGRIMVDDKKVGVKDDKEDKNNGKEDE